MLWLRFVAIISILPCSTGLLDDTSGYLEQTGGCRRYECLGDETILPIALSSGCDYVSPEEWMSSASYQWWVGLHPSDDEAPSDYEKSVRKEIRRMSAQELIDYATAIKAMRNTHINDDYQEYTEFQLFTIVHQAPYAPSSTRFGASFLPWHREYLLRFEIALKRHVANATLGYWNPGLDSKLPKPSDSVLYDDKLFGTCEGNLTGIFEGWTTYDSFCPESRSEEDQRQLKLVYRNCQNTDMGYQYEEMEEHVYSVESYEDLSSKMCLLGDHDLLHNFLKGTTGSTDQGCSVIDPLSWPMHTFLDYYFDRYRTLHPIADVSSEYPAVNDSCHAADSPMIPFTNFTNIDGLSKNYETYYSYEACPYKCSQTSDCDSEYLWCDMSIKKCKSKIKMGGSCKNIMSFDACYESYCVDGLCSNDVSSIDWKKMRIAFGSKADFNDTKSKRIK